MLQPIRILQKHFLKSDRQKREKKKPHLTRKTKPKILATTMTSVSRDNIMWLHATSNSVLVKHHLQHALQINDILFEFSLIRNSVPEITVHINFCSEF